MNGIGITTFKTNPVTDKLRSGQPAVGSWLGLCSPIAAEAMAHVGWDWLVVDTEHAPWGFDTMVNSFRAIQLGGAVPMARVPWNDIVWMQRTLDAGALGSGRAHGQHPRRRRACGQQHALFDQGHSAVGAAAASHPTSTATIAPGPRRTWPSLS